MARSYRLDTPRETRRSLRGNIDPETFGRLSERFARALGTARFLVYMSAFVSSWVLWNSLGPESLRFDEFPFIFLTLILSLQASYAAPLILLAQNRQADRDRIALNEDRAQNARSIADTEYLTRELASLRIALGEVATRDYLRNELGDIAKEIIEELRKPESDTK
ncbi:COG4420 Predicted membrane protein [Candidatus Nanopelagicaceae bacterium]